MLWTLLVTVTVRWCFTTILVNRLNNTCFIDHFTDPCRAISHMCLEDNCYWLTTALLCFECHLFKQVSAVVNWPVQKNRAVESLAISAINYSGRASELGGITNVVDKRRSSILCLSTFIHLSRAKLTAHSRTNMRWQNPEFRKKFQTEVPIF